MKDIMSYMQIISPSLRSFERNLFTRWPSIFQHW